MELTTLARVKLLLSIAATDRDTILKQIISGVSADVAQHLDRDLEKKLYSYTLDVEPGDAVFSVRAFPIDSVSAIYNDPDQVFDASSLIPATDYVVDKRRGRIIFKTSLTYGFQALKIDLNGGMAETVDQLQVTLTSITGTFTAGQTVVGQTSGAKGTVVSFSSPTLVLSVTEGIFVVGEVAQVDASNKGTISTIVKSPLVMSHPHVVRAAELQVANEYDRRNTPGSTSVAVAGGSAGFLGPVKFLDIVKEKLDPELRLLV